MLMRSNSLNPMLGPWFWSLILPLILVPNRAPDFGPLFCSWFWSFILPLILVPIYAPDFGLNSAPSLSPPSVPYFGPSSAPGSLRGSVGGGLPSHRSRGEEASKPENSLQPSLGNSPESATNTKAPSQTIPLRYLWETEHSTRTILMEISKRNDFNEFSCQPYPSPKSGYFTNVWAFCILFQLEPIHAKMNCWRWNLRSELFHCVRWAGDISKGAKCTLWGWPAHPVPPFKVQNRKSHFNLQNPRA